MALAGDAGGRLGMLRTCFLLGLLFVAGFLLGFELREAVRACWLSRGGRAAQLLVPPSQLLLCGVHRCTGCAPWHSWRCFPHHPPSPVSPPQATSGHLPGAGVGSGRGPGGHRSFITLVEHPSASDAAQPPPAQQATAGSKASLKGGRAAARPPASSIIRTEVEQHVEK